MSRDRVVDLEHKLPKLQADRKRRARKRFLLYLSVLLLLIGTAVYLQSSLSDVRSIHVEGAAFTGAEEIEAVSGIERGMKMWGLDLDEHTASILSHETIEDASIRRTWPSTVRIEVEEYRTAAYASAGSSYNPVLSNGNIVDMERPPGDAPVLHGFEEGEMLTKLAQEINRMSTSVQYAISDIIHDPVENDPERLTLYMNDGNVVSTTVSSFADRMEPYAAVAGQLDSSEEGIIHMRINPYFESFAEIDEEEEPMEGEESGGGIVDDVPPEESADEPAEEDTAGDGEAADADEVD
ncbi:cell division protein FtsQ/DivIB [Bacillus daqingensis]|uniref:Cell division protein DivIB n=1 Tax=Bacillus daqingensis TaxID=872396 RepID=A0ABV9NQE4_9BACI